MNREMAARFAGPQTVVTAPEKRRTPGVGEVLIDVSACGICGTDLHFYSGRWPQPSVIPGHEIAGIVSAVGEGAAGWQPGDHVVVEPITGCGECPYCKSGAINLCSDFRFLSIHRDGGFATSMVAPASCLHRVPPGMDLSAAALAEPLAVAVHACRAAGVQEGDTVAVCGAGTIGLLVIAAALECGAAAVISSGRHPHQRQAADRLGAAATAPEDLDAAVREIAGAGGADVVMETVGGAGQAVGQAIGVVRAGGTVVLVGGYTRPTSVLLSRVVAREIRLAGSSFYSRVGSPTDFERALEILQHGDRWEQLITHRYSLESIDQAFAAAANKESGAIKVQVDCRPLRDAAG
ncbi:MAG: alcohol dehydrogenase catalytic domain-containing protein [Chloroflexi bacterium]|nr:alcohol dehydrogenase catalytic domain-containing protein [Chloroflexota bacterium]